MLISRSFLNEQANNRNISEYSYSRNKIISENMMLARRYDSVNNKYVKKYDIFLSHSSLDRRLVLTLVKLFNDAGYSVYVDWIEDTQLDRSQVTRTTAELLRNRMENSVGLAYVSTTNATSSKWCPWELGYFDGRKNNRCCILPIMDGWSFKGQEYLGLYPYLKYEKIQGQDKFDFWVYEQQSDKYVILNAWLKGMSPLNHK